METETVKAVKTITSLFQPNNDIVRLLETFRDIFNYCVQVGLEKGVTSRFKLSNIVYHKLIEYGYHSWYVLSAIETATTILKNYRKAKRRRHNVKTPRARKPMAKIGNQALKLVEDKLRIPLKPRQYFYVKLYERARKLLAKHKIGSVTLTVDKVCIAFSKTVKTEDKPNGWVAIDVNETNVTAVSSN